jgi:signal peptidase I
LRRVARFLAALALVAWFFTLRPQWLGGPAMYVVVRGDSMLPTYQNGDLLVIMSAAVYSPGVTAAYRVPPGELGEGHIVVHRVAGVAGGHFTMKGDNNPEPDPATPAQTDMVGAVALHVPGAGAFIATVLSPTVAGGLAAALVVMYGAARISAPRPTRRQTTASAGD